VLSGSGLVDLYQFFRQSERNPEPEWLTREFENGDRSAVITETALSGADSVCIETVKTFASIYGAEAGNLALKLFAIGGVFVGGGIAPKILPVLKNGEFMHSFSAKGRYQNLLAKIPVKVALNTRAPLLGAAHYALRL
jgi:glucokinase